MVDTTDSLACDKNVVDCGISTDVSEFWTVWNRNNEKVSQKRNDDDSKNEDEDSGLAAKRKQEVLSVLCGYRNDIKKKKMEKFDAINFEDSNDVAKCLKQKRLEAFEPVVAAFNIGDFEVMGNVLRDKCDENVIFSSHVLTEESVGMKPLLIFWGLLHETYPDAMIQMLETRLSTVSCSSIHKVDSKINSNSSSSSSDSSSSGSKGQNKPDVNEATAVNTSCSNSSSSDNAETVPAVPGSYHRVEYVYKFTGTRISDRTLSQTFNKLVKSGILADTTVITNESLTGLISKYMTSADEPETSYVAKSCSFIIETILTFNTDNKIIKWSYAILASDAS